MIKAWFFTLKCPGTKQTKLHLHKILVLNRFDMIYITFLINSGFLSCVQDTQTQMSFFSFGHIKDQKPKVAIWIDSKSTSLRLFLACTLCAELCFILGWRSVNDCAQSYERSADFNSPEAPLEAWKYPFVYIFPSVQLSPLAINKHYEKQCGGRFGIQLFLFSGSGQRCYNLRLCDCVPSHTREGIFCYPPTSFIGPINLLYAKLVTVHFSVRRWQIRIRTPDDDAYWWESWSAPIPSGFIFTSLLYFMIESNGFNVTSDKEL